MRTSIAGSPSARPGWPSSNGSSSSPRKPRAIEIASSRERPRGPLAAEVATFDAALVIGQGPPIPIGDAVHMVMERVTLPDAHDLEQIADDVCKEGAITEDTADVIAMCRACLGSPSVKRAIELGSWWREVPFMLNHAHDGEDGRPRPADQRPRRPGLPGRQRVGRCRLQD